MVCIAWIEVWCLRIVDDADEQTESVDSQECELRWDGKLRASDAEHDGYILVNIAEHHRHDESESLPTGSTTAHAIIMRAMCAYIQPANPGYRK